MTDIYKSATSNSVFIELVDSTTGLPKTGIVHTDVTGSYVRTRSARVAITMATLASASASFSSGGFILIDDTNQPGVYRIDVPDAAFATSAVAVVVTVKATGCRTVSRLFNLVDINNQVACLPNVAAGGVGGLLIAPTTANTGLSNVTQFGGTAGTFAAGIPTAALDSATAAKITAIETFATRVTTGLVADGAVYQFTANMLELAPSGTGGDATLAKQNDILAAIQGTEVIQVASPNVLGNLVLTQGDDYDGVANPKASWTVTTDYTTGWTVRLTIRGSGDAVVYTNTGSVVSATIVAVTIAAPTGLTMTGCPGQWQGKFDVELTHSSGKKKTIAIGTCYINEDQTR